MTFSKDKSIVDMLERMRPDERGWCILDAWEADLCAIGISDPSGERVAYVSTYNLPPDRYYCECEANNARSPLGYDVVCEGHNLTFDELLAALERHLL